jgi:hypothetical protein
LLSIIFISTFVSHHHFWPRPIEGTRGNMGVNWGAKVGGVWWLLWGLFCGK